MNPLELNFKTENLSRVMCLINWKWFNKDYIVQILK